MKEEIISKLDNAKQLEKLYRENKAAFKKGFELAYPTIQNSKSAQFWHERLKPENKGISWGSQKELIYVLVISLVAGIIAKIPDFTTLDIEYYYPRNIAFIVFPMLAIYFAWKQSLQLKKTLFIAFLFLISVIYINFLPINENSDTLTLACLHLPLFLFTVLAYTFTGAKFKNYQKRISFLRYNGDLVVMTTVLLIAGGILSAVTIGLFQLIDIKIEEFYFRNIAIWGLAAAPIIGTYLVQSNPYLVKNVSPIIAKVFSPLVLLMLIVYLASIIYTGKDLYHDRQFLMIFNILLIGVMAIILFSIAETSKNTATKTSILILFLLSIVSIIVNGIALSAIMFRITEWGITPNRLAVLGSNVLILINLVMVTYRLFMSLKKANDLTTVEDTIARFLPIYSLWVIVVTFIFPLLFNFK